MQEIKQQKGLIQLNIGNNPFFTNIVDTVQLETGEKMQRGNFKDKLRNNSKERRKSTIKLPCRYVSYSFRLPLVQENHDFQQPRYIDLGFTL